MKSQATSERWDTYITLPENEKNIKCRILLLISATFFLFASAIVLSTFFVLLNRDLNQLKDEIKILKIQLESNGNWLFENDLSQLKSEVKNLKLNSEELLKRQQVLPPIEEDSRDYMDSLYDEPDGVFNDSIYNDYFDLIKEINKSTEPQNETNTIILNASEFTKDIKDRKIIRRSIDSNSADEDVAVDTRKPRRRSYPGYQQESDYSTRPQAQLDAGGSTEVQREQQAGDELYSVSEERPLRRYRSQKIRAGRPLPTAHFHGDTSKYVLGLHDNFNGNGHLRHPQGTYVDWIETSWFRSLGMEKYFHLNNGVLTIRESGLYFIYAQIYYLDEHDINGFMVNKNDKVLLQCTTMTHSMTKVLKGNTCYTAAAEYLQENDRVTLADMSESHFSKFEPGKSFFGVIKLGDIKILQF